MVDKLLEKLAFDDSLRCLITYTIEDKMKNDSEEVLDRLEVKNKHSTHQVHCV
jgi:hypothetical protein